MNSFRNLPALGTVLSTLILTAIGMGLDRIVPKSPAAGWFYNSRRLRRDSRGRWLQVRHVCQRGNESRPDLPRNSGAASRAARPFHIRSPTRHHDLEDSVGIRGCSRGGRCDSGHRLHDPENPQGLNMTALSIQYPEPHLSDNALSSVYAE